MVKSLFCLGFALLFSLSSVAAPTVEYRINVDQATHHMAKVTIEFPEHDADELEVRLPVWRAGRYQILDLSNGVREFAAESARGKTLDWKMKDKAAWLIQSEGNPVTVSYRIYANQLGNRTRHIDDSHAFLDASGVFMYSPRFRANPLTVKLTVPRQWRSRSGMTSAGRHKFKADNYDVLIDSPIETGVHSFHEFEAGDRDYEILFWGRGNYDEQQTIKDLAKLDAEVEKIWGSFPYQRYLYMIHATTGPRGATEHINSTIIQRQRDRFAAREDYISFITTAAHELVHTWNVKAYRPSGLVPYDYQKENYTSLLWVAEGSTSYFDTLITRRAGITTEKEFHEDLAKGIEKLLNRPGRQAQSVSEASFYNWIESTNDFTLNHSVNIYAKGSLVSWLLDFKIRQATDNKKSSEDVHRLLYQRFKATEKGFTDADLLKTVNEVTGQDFSSFWQQYVWGKQAIDFDALLDYVGLELVGKEKEKSVIDLGLSFDKDLTITGVKKDSPAWNAGLTKGDILLSMDELRLTEKNIKQRIKNLSPDSDVVIHFFRRDELQSVEVAAQVNPAKKLRVSVQKDATQAQKNRYKSWTGHELGTVEKNESES